MEKPKKITSYEYNNSLDIIHIYNSNISNGVKGVLSVGDYSIDVGMENEVVGVEIEEASKVLGMDRESLKDLDSVEILTRASKNLLFIGVRAIKSKEIATVQFNINLPKALSIPN